MDNDLAALFDNMDGFKDDLMDFGVAGLGAVGATVAWGYVEQKVLPEIPFVKDSPVAQNVLAIVTGVAGGMAMAKVNKNLATGIAVGLAARGIAGILGSLKNAEGEPVIPGLSASNPGRVGGLGLTAAENVLLFPRGTPQGSNASIEEVNGLGAATSTIEEIGLSGLAATLTA